MNNYINQTAMLVVGVCIGVVFGFLLHTFVSSQTWYWDMPSIFQIERLFGTSVC